MRIVCVWPVKWWSVVTGRCASTRAFGDSIAGRVRQTLSNRPCQPRPWGWPSLSWIARHRPQKKPKKTMDARNLSEASVLITYYSNIQKTTARNSQLRTLRTTLSTGPSASPDSIVYVCVHAVASSGSCPYSTIQKSLPRTHVQTHTSPYWLSLHSLLP